MLAYVEELTGALHTRGTRLLLAEVTADVRAEFDRYGLTAAVGADAYFETVAAVIDAFQASSAESG